MLVIVILLVVSLFFPPAWIAFFGYIGYLVLTKKTRRDRVILQEIRKSIAQGRKQAVLKYLYFDAAKSFAAEHGASMSPYKDDPSDDCLIVDLLIDGIEYGVCFQRWMKDETLLTVTAR